MTLAKLFRTFGKSLFERPPLGTERLSQEAVDWYETQNEALSVKVFLCIPLIAVGPMSWFYWLLPLRVAIGFFPVLYVVRIWTDWTLVTGGGEFEFAEDGTKIGVSKKVYFWRFEHYYLYVWVVIPVVVAFLVGLSKY